MTSAGATLVRAAARNNAEWCAAVGRTHGTPGIFGERAWHSARRTPPYHPDAVTLAPDAAPPDFMPFIDTASPGCSVKDSFAALDLTSAGFEELFTASWIHRAAGSRGPTATALTAERISTAGDLRDWQVAWSGGDGPDIFRPALLADPHVLILALRDGEHPCGGFALNRGGGAVGLSNLFAAAGHAAAVWSSAISAATRRFPHLPLVGYERGDDLAHALAGGFTVLGPLRVWVAGFTGTSGTR